MVRRAFRSLIALVVFPLLASNLAAKDPGDYKLGDIVEQDVVTPVALVVTDEATTHALRQREADRVLVHLRYYTNAADEADFAFRSSFENTRAGFLGLLQATFGHAPLSAADIESTRFSRLLQSFGIQNTSFPVDTNLAALWASGQSVQELELSAASKLRDVMQRPVRSTESMPPDLKIGSMARLIILASTNEIPTFQMADQRGVTTAKTNLISFQRTKTELIDSFPEEQHAIAHYVASFVQANCFVDAPLTRQIRAKRTESILATDRYEAGQLIARRGQSVDARVKAALDELHGKLALIQMQQSVEQAQLRASRQMRWLIAGGSAAALLTVVLLVRLSRRRKPATLLPAPIASGPVAGTQPYPAEETVRSGLIAQLAGLIANRFVQRLLAQRAQLIETHEKAAVEVDQLGERLESIHTRVQDRLVAYERRIAELEKDLESKSAENRELIKAELQTIRRQLEIERARSQVGLN